MEEIRFGLARKGQKETKANRRWEEAKVGDSERGWRGEKMGSGKEGWMDGWRDKTGRWECETRGMRRRRIEEGARTKR